MLAGSHVSPRQAQTTRLSVSAPDGSSNALLQEQLERAAKATETAIFRAAEAESRTATLSAELQAARNVEQAWPPALDTVHAFSWPHFKGVEDYRL